MADMQFSYGLANGNSKEARSSQRTKPAYLNEITLHVIQISSV
jgi:hypothetical protein